MTLDEFLTELAAAVASGKLSFTIRNDVIETPDRRSPDEALYLVRWTTPLLSIEDSLRITRAAAGYRTDDDPTLRARLLEALGLQEAA